MQYKVERIGSSYSKKNIKELENLLNFRASEGYIFHSAFKVVERKFFGIGRQDITYLAVYIKE